MKVRSLLLPTATCLAMPMLASAQVATHTFQFNSGAPLYPVSSTDLIQNGSPDLSSVNTNYVRCCGGSNAYPEVTAATDGDNGPPVLNDAGAPFSITYNLNTAANPQGYNISQIVTTAAAGDYRARQEYEVLYSLVGDPGTFVNLIPDNHTTDRGDVFQTNNSTTPGDLAGGSGGQSQITINITGLTGVAALRISQTAPSGNGANGAQATTEYDVIGSAVPEPTSLAALATLGGLGLLRRRRS